MLWFSADSMSNTKADSHLYGLCTSAQSKVSAVHQRGSAGAEDKLLHSCATAVQEEGVRV